MEKIIKTTNIKLIKEVLTRENIEHFDFLVEKMGKEWAITFLESIPYDKQKMKIAISYIQSKNIEII